jgi:hypothetical protein
MTPNIASPIFNTLLTAFFLVILMGVALGTYAAIQLARAQNRYEADEAQMAAWAPAEEFAVADEVPIETVVAPELVPDVIPAGYPLHE